MHRVLGAAVLLFCLSHSTVFAATVTKNAVAVANTNSAISAMGGAVAVAAINDSVISGNITPSAGSWTKARTFVWETSGTQFRCQTTSDTQTQIFVSGNGQPAVSVNGVVTPLFYHVSQAAPPFQIPGLVLQATLADTVTTLSDAGTGTVNGHSVFEVQMNSSTASAATATQQTWYFDSTTGLPVQVDFRVPSNDDMNNWIQASVTFSSFSQVNGVSVPFSMTYYEAGVAIETFTVTSAGFNVGVNPSDFNLLGN